MLALGNVICKHVICLHCYAVLCSAKPRERHQFNKIKDYVKEEIRQQMLTKILLLNSDGKKVPVLQLEVSFLKKVVVTSQINARISG